MIGPANESDRGMSVAVTHVLTIGITTILIAMLLMSGSTLLDSETDRSTETSLETVGERLAGEIDNVDRIADEGAENVSITADHPRQVANSRYDVELVNNCSGDAPLINDNDIHCVKLTAHDVEVTVYVPFVTEADIDGSENSARGGSIEITYDSGDDEIEITEADR